MKKFGLIVLGVLLVVSIALGGLYLNRAGLIQDGVRKQLEALTGTPVEISLPDIQKGLDQVTIPSMKIMNPPGYKQAMMAELLDVQLSCDWVAGLMGQGVKCSKIQGKLTGVYLERHQSQGFNLKDLKVFSDEVLKQSSAKGGFQITRLEIAFGRAEMAEYVTGQEEAQKTEVDLGNRVEVYSQITDPAVLIYGPALRIIPEFKRGNMGIPRSLLQQKIANSK